MKNNIKVSFKKICLTVALFVITVYVPLSCYTDKNDELFRMNSFLKKEFYLKSTNKSENLNPKGILHTTDYKVTVNGTNTISDIDGNIYKTIKIGNQIWLASNLRTSTYNDGTKIPKVFENEEWAHQKNGAFCWYYNDSSRFEEHYGKLYNWYAVETQKLCPCGWHVPKYSEWLEITNNLGGRNFAGGKMKSTKEMHWKQPNSGATNESGFNAVASGYRNSIGQFYEYSRFARWWSTTEGDSNHAFGLGIYFGYGTVLKNNNNKNMGYTVRCIKD